MGFDILKVGGGVPSSFDDAVFRLEEDVITFNPGSIIAFQVPVQF